MVLAKKILVVLSGKGGVGKSTVACQIALCYREQGLRVGMLDIDLCGPSVPKMLQLNNSSVLQSSSGAWVPVFYQPNASVEHEEAMQVDTPEQNGNHTASDEVSKNAEKPRGHLEVMSIGFLLSKETDAVVWRGPKKNAMIKQFLTDVQWSEELDLLVIDTPPGTSDEHMSIVEHLKSVLASDDVFANSVGAVLVTTPQAVSVHDVQREIGFCLKCQLTIVGIIENMSGYICSHCSHCSNIFSQGGGKSLASKKNIPFLGSIPVDTNLALAVDRGENFIREFNSSVAVGFIEQIILKLNSAFFGIDSSESSMTKPSTTLKV
ncbi:cytosolic Fe-S cluster assembly factor NUBP2-like [Convolutriloba macropyga]|uniref:cytosolic Fe-S cluster assembly factor NUBP2-like n=1 Tax=Convolutriloba macropyga TaxID=536237 RepID=UPI003F5224B1